MWILRGTEEPMVAVRGPHGFGLQEDKTLLKAGVARGRNKAYL